MYYFGKSIYVVEHFLSLLFFVYYSLKITKYFIVFMLTHFEAGAL